MEKHNEKQPVDDLFARKLKNMTLPPSPDGFTRLQARMGRGEPEGRVIFWRNPVVLQYMAVAACLLMICLFGWLYLSAETPLSGAATVSVNKPIGSPEKQHPRKQPNLDLKVGVTATGSIPDRKTPASADSEAIDLPFAERERVAVGKSINDNRRAARTDRTTRRVETTFHDTPPAVPITPTERVAGTEANTLPVEPKSENQVAAVTNKPASVAERVLIVTIAEPKALLAARQVVESPSGEQGIVAVDDRPEKENKAANLWQQVKRMKQGEVFARKDVNDDERGLISRAYSGLKQTLDKDKSVKQ